VLRDSDFDIQGVSASGLVNGFTYSSFGLRVDQKGSTQAHWKLGLDTDTWTLVLMPGPFDPITGATFPDTIGNVPWLQAAFRQLRCGGLPGRGGLFRQPADLTHAAGGRRAGRLQNHSSPASAVARTLMEIKARRLADHAG